VNINRKQTKRNVNGSIDGEREHVNDAHAHLTPHHSHSLAMAIGGGDGWWVVVGGGERK
jgi:hypothetical protein